MQKNKTYRPSPTALLNPRCDASFTTMFTQETKESHAALLDFIATILDKEVKDLYLIPNEPALDMSREKQMSFDVSSPIFCLLAKYWWQEFALQILACCTANKETRPPVAIGQRPGSKNMITSSAQSPKPPVS